MKVVLFCGGLGMRIRDAGESVPKPMVTIGYRPILWHVMKYYAHYGHKDFVLCLGYRGDVIKNYFLNYSECVSNDFVLSEGGKKLELMKSDIHDWKITFVETGATSNIGQRLKAVERHVRDEPEFLANYSDGLTDLPLPVHVDHFRQQNAIASFVSVPIRINGGFFVFRSEIFDHIRNGEELVCEPFQRLIRAGRLAAYEHHGFWMSMDTFKDRQQLEEIYERGDAPWEVWNDGKAGPGLGPYIRASA
ncbi:MAG: glucose-1-phosphate cytidylyltransferase [Acidobacteria bacterium]|nr:MAG: glucose-1-phosphate cytidylyltransferase [Acidobacteriota bacterium]